MRPPVDFQGPAANQGYDAACVRIPDSIINQGSSVRKLSALDLAFFLAESEGSPKHVAGLMLFRKPAGNTRNFGAPPDRRTQAPRPTNRAVQPGDPFHRTDRAPLAAGPRFRYRSARLLPSAPQIQHLGRGQGIRLEPPRTGHGPVPPAVGIPPDRRHRGRPLRGVYQDSPRLRRWYDDDLLAAKNAERRARRPDPEAGVDDAGPPFPAQRRETASRWRADCAIWAPSPCRKS